MNDFTNQDRPGVRVGADSAPVRSRRLPTSGVSTAPAAQDKSAALAELSALCEGFFDDCSWIEHVQVVSADSMTETARRLLVHDNHMTATLKAAYGQDVALDVLEHRRQGHTYRRKILLTVDQGKRFVEFGIVRLNLECVAEEVRDAILNRRTPLGAILGKHNVLTHVEPKWFLRFPSESPILQYLNSSRREAFGRLGMIYCDGEPAVELLEVVPD